MRCRAGDSGSISPETDRPRHTWHLYAPNVPFWEQYDRPELLEEDMWLQFDFNKPWPPLAERKFAAIFDPEDRFVEYVRAMYEVQQHGRPGRQLILQGLLLAVLGEVLTAIQAGASGKANDPWQICSHGDYDRENRLLSTVDAAITRKLSSPPSLEQLAEELDMSVSSLAHRFKAETGLTVVQRIQWLRIRMARRMLLQSDTGVKSVSHKLRFSSPAYFAKVFQKVTGMTPSTYIATARRP